MEVGFEIKGLDKIANASARVQQAVAEELNKGVFASAQKVEKEAKVSILQGSKTGRIYRRRTVTHRASAPGEAPANDTGRLANSIKSYNLSRFKFAESIVVAGRGLAKYATMLEFGTAKMAARPFMFPAVERSRQWIMDRLTRAVSDGIKKSAKR